MGHSRVAHDIVRHCLAAVERPVRYACVMSGDSIAWCSGASVLFDKRVAPSHWPIGPLAHWPIGPLVRQEPVGVCHCRVGHMNGHTVCTLVPSSCSQFVSPFGLPCSYCIRTTVGRNAYAYDGVTHYDDVTMNVRQPILRTQGFSGRLPDSHGSGV